MRKTNGPASEVVGKDLTRTCLGEHNLTGNLTEQRSSPVSVVHLIKGEYRSCDGSLSEKKKRERGGCTT